MNARWSKSKSPFDEDREPTAAELAAIDREWPLIEAELMVLDAEIAQALAEDHASELDRRRVRRAERRVLDTRRITSEDRSEVA